MEAGHFTTRPSDTVRKMPCGVRIAWDRLCRPGCSVFPREWLDTGPRPRADAVPGCEWSELRNQNHRPLCNEADGWTDDFCCRPLLNRRGCAPRPRGVPTTMKKRPVKDDPLKDWRKTTLWLRALDGPLVETVVWHPEVSEKERVELLARYAAQGVKIIRQLTGTKATILQGQYLQQ
ncbi:hypothetical protein LCGC14_1131390 [marine sediment metagenome]|uniref:Uncharacterized protein n=1 Tax=marine sediment metagenome TaxID=412755 RepID=A0A0F9PJ80_9ZZZZ